MRGGEGGRCTLAPRASAAEGRKGKKEVEVLGFDLSSGAASKGGEQVLTHGDRMGGASCPKGSTWFNA